MNYFLLMRLIYFPWQCLKYCYRCFCDDGLPRKRHVGRRKTNSTKEYYYLSRRKPDWVKNEIIRLRALMPGVGCRKIAHVFNRLYKKSKAMTVGKTFVNTTMRQHHYEIQVLRKKIKHRKPKPIARNIIWAMDLTGKTDCTGKQHIILSVVEHSSRAALFLGAINSKSSCDLILILCGLIKQFGTPKCIRTDNEAVFTSRWFTCRLFLLGIRHQTTELHCPWQNGRVERFFGTLKERLNNWEVDSQKQLNEALKLFRFWYLFIRPHQYLDGRTPAEVWNGVDIEQQGYRERSWFEAWDGLLTGYYLPT